MKRRERTYIAIITALVIHAIVLLILSEVPHTRYFPPDDFAEVSFFEEEEDDNPEEEEETHTMEDLLRDRIREDVANLVADKNAQRTEERQSYVSKSAQERIDEAVESELKEFEREAFETMAEKRKQNQSEQSETENDNASEDAKGDQEQQEQYDYFGKSFNGNVTAEYDLPGREARRIHIPGYKCKGGGVVKVNITVNPAGQVVEASIDQNGSKYSGACLPEEAINSAKKSVFFIKSGAPKRQNGTITYRFIPQ